MQPRKRRVRLPVILFILTCMSTFWAGASIEPSQYLVLSLEQQSLMPVRRVLLEHYREGLLYMAAVLGILLTHEMGHFFATVWYRVPASLPYFLPLPISIIGTVGAVIGINAQAADRRQIFDIGVAGPLAGLVIAVPVMWYGAHHLTLDPDNGTGPLRLAMPLGASLIMQAAGVDAATFRDGIWIGHLQGNPLFIAGWFGFLMTGLNMLPVSQLDGGHVSYCLFGRAAHWIARLVMVLVIAFIVLDTINAQLLDFSLSPALKGHAYIWGLMVVLVLLMGPDHPPTADDTRKLGLFRKAIGFVSLLIPIFCLPPYPFLR